MDAVRRVAIVEVGRVLGALSNEDVRRLQAGLAHGEGRRELAGLLRDFYRQSPEMRAAMVERLANAVPLILHG